MTNPTPYNCYLEVLSGGKCVPYGDGVRPEGTINHGFRSLKGRPEDVKQIPEVADDPALAEFLTRVSDLNTSFFTVGCVSGRVEDDSGHRMSGYVEICINDRALVCNAVNYFQIFWRFTQSLEEKRFPEQVTLHWQLQGASFLDANCAGITCSIIINTHYVPEASVAYEAWKRTLAVLGDAFVEPEPFPFTRIY